MQENRKMDKLIITVPDWVICAIGLWFILCAVDSGMRIYILYLERKLEKLKKEATSTQDHNAYYELLMAVQRKFHNESRHETALRYIKEAENKPCGCANSAQTDGKQVMKVKGNHPLAELLAKHLLGIETVPKNYQKRMINRAIKAAVKWHEEQKTKTEQKGDFMNKNLASEIFKPFITIILFLLFIIFALSIVVISFAWPFLKTVAVFKWLFN